MLYEVITVGVDPAEFHGVDSRFFRQHFHGALDGKRRLGIAVSPHCLGIGVVGIHALGLVADIGNRITSYNVCYTKLLRPSRQASSGKTGRVSAGGNPRRIVRKLTDMYT